MVYSKKKRYSKKRSYKPKGTPQVSISRPLGTKKKFVTRYCELGVTLDPGIAGVRDGYVFWANGLYDPNLTGAGHQPIGFDQVMPFFDHYTVIASKMTVTATNTDAVNEQLIGIHVNDSATLLTDINQYLENGNTSYAVISPMGGGNETKVVTMKCSPPKFLSISDPLDNYDIKGTVTSNPSEGVYFHIFAAPTSGNNAGIIRLHVKIDYVAMLTEPKTLALS